MLFLRTGLPGAGKTLNAIREIDTEHQPDPNDPTKRLYADPDHPDMPPRTIYYYGIPEVKHDRLKSNWVEFDHPETWYDLPDGSVIVIDEAQRIFGNDGTRQRPEKVTRFETHRHQGLDIHLITQHPSLLSTPVRKLVGKHINFIRPYGRTKGIFRHEYEFCIDSPEKRSYFKQAQEEKVKLDPSYFGTYKSSTVHTHKPVTPTYLKRMPLYAAMVIVPVVLLVFLGKYMSDRSSAEITANVTQTELTAGQGVAVANAATGSTLQPASKAEPEDDYLESLNPRIEGVPHTAPRYDRVATALDFPRLVCAASFEQSVVDRNRERGHPIGTDKGRDYSCTCYTQQVTRVDTAADFCLDVVRNGIFDDTRRQPRYATSGGELTSSMPHSAAVARVPAGQAPPNVRPYIEVVSDTTQRPWR
jgi:zona occludens toxin